MQLLPVHVHRWIYFFGLSVVAIGLPVSEFLMSVGQLILAGNFFLEGHIVEKAKRFWNNKTAVLLSSVLLMHLLGLLYTSDVEYGLKDIRIKAPLLILPVIIGCAEPLSKQLFNWLMAIFVATVVVSTFISMGVYHGVIHTKLPITDIRDISIFISHIRFSLLICFSVFITAWYIFYETSITQKFLLTAVVVWLMIFLTILDSLTGIVVLIIVAVVIMLYNSFASPKKILRIAAVSGVVIMTIGVIIYIRPLILLGSVTHPIDFSKMELITTHGNPYVHDTTVKQTENGYPVWTYVCWNELRQVWNKRSTIEFYGKNSKGDEVRYTLVRYLTSKGLRKDSVGVASLSDEEIKLISDGIANVNYLGRSGVTIRVMETLWEFQDYKIGGDINGHSAVQRLEFWKAGWQIFKKHPLIGVGTGDIKNAYVEQYAEMNSPLDSSHRLRSHNQFVSIAVAFGILGLIWFLIALAFPFLRYKMWNNYFYFTFFLIAVLSFLNEDTLETQPGVTFFAFFNALFLFGTYLSVPAKAEDLSLKAEKN
jgi:hypothetical protein